MSDHIRDRINRKLDALTEERLYQVLDFVEFLESKYAARQTPAPNPLQKFAEGIEDRLRAGRVSASTIAETMGFLNKAVGVLNGAVAAGKSVASDLASAAQRVGSAVTDAATPTAPSAPTQTPTQAPSTSAPQQPPRLDPLVPPTGSTPPSGGEPSS